jgi:hypothetical protein
LEEDAHTRRGDIAIRQPATRDFFLEATASLLRFMAKRPICIQLQHAGQQSNNQRLIIESSQLAFDN